MFKYKLMLLGTLGEEAFGITLPQVKIANNRFYRSSMGTSGLLKAYQRASQFAYRLVIYTAHNGHHQCAETCQRRDKVSCRRGGHDASITSTTES